MPRQPRYDLPGLAQHVIQRGNNRQPLFFDDANRLRCLEDLGDVVGRTGCQLHAYVLMTNHVHLLVTPMAPRGISRLMQGLGRRYVSYVNHVYKRTGTLWEGRYKASLVAADDYLLACMRYIELNPVRAGMVSQPGDYRWSSYGWNAWGRDAGIELADPERYTALGSNTDDRRAAYRELFDVAIDAVQLHEIREATNGCMVLGNDRFKEQIAAAIGRRVERGKAGRPKKEETAV